MQPSLSPRLFSATLDYAIPRPSRINKCPCCITTKCLSTMSVPEYPLPRGTHDRRENHRQNPSPGRESALSDRFHRNTLWPIGPRSGNISPPAVAPAAAPDMMPA